MPPRILVVTGPPGIGKSTVVSRVVYLLRMQGHGVGGCISRELRSGRERAGFRMLDLMSGREGELASVRGTLGPKVGRYRVNLADLSKVGARALVEAADRADVIVIDEVGPMELTSPDFKKGVRACLASGKPVLAVVHEEMKDPLVEEIRESPERAVSEVTLQNRGALAEALAESLLRLLAEQQPAP